MAQDTFLYEHNKLHIVEVHASLYYIINGKILNMQGEFMRKISIGVIVLFFVVMLASCSSEPNNSAFRLDAPTNLATERNVLTFKAVEGASSYILIINGDNL